MILNSFLVLLSACTISAPVTNEPKKTVPVFYDPMEVQTDDRIYKDNIKSVVCHNANSEIAPPIIAINTEEFITLRFDDLDNNIKTYNYGIIHCNADWTQSSLMEIEYLDGYFQGNVTHYDYSFNTLMPYINWRLDFPSSDIKILLPGNYVLFVYENNDKESPVLTRRFMVYEPRTSITYEYKRSDDPEERNYKQEIDFNVNAGNLVLNNGFSDLNVCILQNYRWDNALTGLTPKYIRSNELVYNLDEPQTFLGMNEFRHINLASTSIKSGRVLTLAHDSTLYNMLLYRDDKRSYKKYSTYGDINGRFKIHRDNSNDHHTQADYVWVTFHLDQNTELTDSDIYLFGLFTDWQVKPEYKLQFDNSLGIYFTTIKIKQGNYDFMYVRVPKTGKEIDYTFIEGTHFDTENQYTILVYYHDIKRNTDLLVGFQDFNNVNRR